eukprot:scaffold242525_cov31-Attheya_sp.AAC.1
MQPPRSSPHGPMTSRFSANPRSPTRLPDRHKEPIVEYLNSNVVMLKWMIAKGYGDARTLERRIARMQE